ncbi:MAG: transcriptional repressor [Tannerellaceae bacterium]|jgi:Fur family ferric uptake transcriptional regulator|nr:transcriptional repressor [Tannerellaceae bacterium]
MDSKLYNEIQESFTNYLTEKKLRKTEERYAILEGVCAFTGHFDIVMLHNKIKEARYYVSKSTVYNTLEVLLDAGIVVSHQTSSQSVQYELKKYAEMHSHLFCTKCGSIREIKNAHIKGFLNAIKVPRFTPDFYSLYIYGTCSKCKNKIQREKKQIK